MKALVYHGPGRLCVEQAPRPSPAPDEVLVRTRAVGICGSDLHAFRHGSARRAPPLIMGHEAAGVVEQVGARVADVQPGDRVVPHSVLACGACRWCELGETNRCPRARVLGVNTPGCYAEYFVAPATSLYRMPEEMPFARAALAEPLSVGLHAVHLALVRGPRSLLVLGAGVIGLAAVDAARRAGLKRVAVADPDERRVDVALGFGAERAGENEAARYDAVVDAVGLEATFSRAVRQVESGGILVLVGMSTPAVRLDLLDTVARELAITGSYVSTAREFAEALLHLGPREDRLIELTRPLDQGPEAFAALDQSQGGVLKAMLIVDSGTDEPMPGRR